VSSAAAYISASRVDKSSVRTLALDPAGNLFFNLPDGSVSERSPAGAITIVWSGLWCGERGPRSGDAARPPTHHPPPPWKRAAPLDWCLPQIHSYSFIEINRPELLKMPGDTRTPAQNTSKDSIPAVKMTTGSPLLGRQGRPQPGPRARPHDPHLRSPIAIPTGGAPPALQSRWSPFPSPYLANVRVADDTPGVELLTSAVRAFELTRWRGATGSGASGPRQR
jgi:hypothetical protein